MQSNSYRVALTTLLAWFACCLAPCACGADRPNILFIMSDDHAYQAISAYGSNRNKTPNIDRLAKEGMRFDRAFVTNSICGPSRAVILTGKYSHLNGFPDNSGPGLVQRQAADGPQAAAGGGLHDGGRRQVAPRQRPDRLRLLAHPARARGRTTTRR